MKNFSWIKVGLFQLFIIGLFVGGALLVSLGGLVVKLSFDAVIEGWKDILGNGDFLESIRLIWFCTSLIAIPLSQGMISDKTVSNIKKLFNN